MKKSNPRGRLTRAEHRAKMHEIGGVSEHADVARRLARRAAKQGDSYGTLRALSPLWRAGVQESQDEALARSVGVLDILDRDFPCDFERNPGRLTTRDVRDRVEQFFEPVIRLRYSARGHLFTIDTAADRELARKMGIPSYFSEADYDRHLAQAGKFGVGFETVKSNPDSPEIEVIPANQHMPGWRPDMWVVRVDGRLIFHGDRETAKRTAREYIRKNRIRGYQMTFGENPGDEWLRKFKQLWERFADTKLAHREQVEREGILRWALEDKAKGYTPREAVMHLFQNPGRGSRRRDYRRNPDYSKIKGFEPWMAQNPQFVQAVNKYVEFHGTMPASIKAKDVPGLGSREDVQFLVHMGKAMDTTYKPTHKKSTKYGSSYIHEFGEDLGRKPKDDELPDQVCTPDGKGILTFGGRFEVKDWVRK